LGEYVLRRLWQTIPVLFGVSPLAFGARAVPPYPSQQRCAAAGLLVDAGGHSILVAAILSFLGLGI
jgi:hypothetical protein